MKFDRPPGDQEQDLMSMWQKTVLPGRMDEAHIMQEIARRMQRFDRVIWWRNLREYAAGAVLIAYFCWRSLYPASRLLALAGIVAVAFVLIYLWRNHRQTPPLDPSADGKSYQAALLSRYDTQIRLLRRVKYWYVLPLYLWMLLVIAMTSPSNAIGRRIGGGIFVTVFSLFVIWLNEGYAVKKLIEKRKKAEALLEEGKNEE